MAAGSLAAAIANSLSPRVRLCIGGASFLFALAPALCGLAPHAISLAIPRLATLLDPAARFVTAGAAPHALTSAVPADDSALPEDDASEVGDECFGGGRARCPITFGATGEEEDSPLRFAHEFRISSRVLDAGVPTPGVANTPR